MEKLKLFIIFLFVIAESLLFTGCPSVFSEITIELNEENFDKNPSDTVKFVVRLLPDIANRGAVGQFSITDGGSFNFDTDYVDIDTTVVYKFDYYVPENVEDTTIIIRFTAYDSHSGYASVKQAYINVGGGELEVVRAKGIKATYISTSLDYNNEMMYVLGSEGVTTEDGNSTNGDLAFVWQTTVGYSVCSPDADWIKTLYSYNGINYTTSDKKNTKIQKYTGNWADLNEETINALQVTSETVQGGGNGVQSVNEGDILIYETADGRKGAIKITSNEKVIKYMTADFVYQKTPANNN